MVKIAACSNLCVVGVLLLWAIICADLRIRDIAFVVIWDYLTLDENDSVNAFAESRVALSKASEFLYAKFAPQFLVHGVHQ